MCNMNSIEEKAINLGESEGVQEELEWVLMQML